MAKKFRPAGGTPSANRKIVEVNQAQGFGNMGNMQGTTRVIYDSRLITTSTLPTTINFFEDCKQRNFPLTNLTENKLQVGETMAMQRFSIFLMYCASGTTRPTGVFPINHVSGYWGLYASVMSFIIAQDTVVKKLPLTSMYAPFNPNSKFVGMWANQTLAADPTTYYPLPQDIYHFQTNLIIPPQIEFIAQLQMPAFTAAAGVDTYLTMKIEGIGSLYAPKSTY